VITSLNSINQLTCDMVKCGFLFEVQTEFLNIIKTSFGFKGLTETSVVQDDSFLGYSTV
jgi:hypothetical protein